MSQAQDARERVLSANIEVEESDQVQQLPDEVDGTNEVEKVITREEKDRERDRHIGLKGQVLTGQSQNGLENVITSNIDIGENQGSQKIPPVKNSIKKVSLSLYNWIGAFFHNHTQQITSQTPKPKAHFSRPPQSSSPDSKNHIDTDNCSQAAPEIAHGHHHDSESLERDRDDESKKEGDLKEGDIVEENQGEENLEEVIRGKERQRAGKRKQGGSKGEDCGSSSEESDSEYIFFEGMNDQEIEEVMEKKERDYEAVKEMGKSMFLAEFIVKHYVKIIGVWGLLVGGLVGIIIPAWLYMPTPPSNRDYLDFTDIRTRMLDMREGAEMYIQKAQYEDGNVPFQLIPHADWSLLITIECVDGARCTDDIMTPKTMLFLDEVDKLIEQDPMWPQVCLRESEENYKCAKSTDPNSRGMALGTPLSIFKVGYKEPVDSYTKFGMDWILFGFTTMNQDNYQTIKPMLSEEFTITHRTANKLRLMIQFGGPFKTYRKRHQTVRDLIYFMEQDVANWQVALNDNLQTLATKPEYSDYLRVHVFGRTYFTRQYSKRLIGDAVLSAIGVIVLWIIMTFHMQSFMMTSAAQLAVPYSVPMILVTYRAIIGISNLTAFNMLLMFVGSGYLVDNSYLIWSTWKQSEAYPQLKGNQASRMAFTLRKTHPLLIASTLTTAGIYYSAILTRIMPLQALGYFAAGLYPIFYLLTLLQFTALIILYDSKIRKHESTVYQCLRKTVKCIYCQQLAKKYRKIRRILRQKDRKAALRKRKSGQVAVEVLDGDAKDRGDNDHREVSPKTAIRFQPQSIFGSKDEEKLQVPMRNPQNGHDDIYQVNEIDGEDAGAEEEVEWDLEGANGSRKEGQGREGGEDEEGRNGKQGDYGLIYKSNELTDLKKLRTNEQIQRKTQPVAPFGSKVSHDTNDRYKQANSVNILVYREPESKNVKDNDDEQPDNLYEGGNRSGQYDSPGKDTLSQQNLDHSLDYLVNDPKNKIQKKIEEFLKGLNEEQLVQNAQKQIKDNRSVNATVTPQLKQDYMQFLRTPQGIESALKNLESIEIKKEPKEKNIFEPTSNIKYDNQIQTRNMGLTINYQANLSRQDQPQHIDRQNIPSVVNLANQSDGVELAETANGAVAEVVESEVSDTKFERLRERCRMLNIQKEKLSGLERFFYGPYASFVICCRWPIFIIGLAAGIYGFMQSSQLKPLSRFEDYLPDDHYISKAISKTTTGFKLGGISPAIDVEIIWGVETTDKNGTDYYDTNEFGKIIWDDEFDPSSEENQRELYVFCQELKKRKELLLYEGSVSCWIEGFREFLFQKGERFPVKLDSLEIQGLEEQSLKQFQYLKFMRKLNEFVTEDTLGIKLREGTILGIVDDRLIYSKFIAKSTGGLFDPYKKKVEVYNQWEQTLSNFSKTAPSGINKPKQVAGLNWPGMMSEVAWFDAVRYGYRYALLFAFIFLVFGTLNVVMSLMVSLGIFLILSTSLWVLVLTGWEVGMNVAVASTFALGFSVNHTTFIGVAFINSYIKSSREQRMRNVLMSTGPSIVGSAYSMAPAFCVFFLSQVTFYHKVAVINISVLLISTLFSLTWFTSFCYICAPQGNFGSISYLISRVYEVLRGIDPDKDEGKENKGE